MRFSWLAAALLVLAGHAGAQLAPPDPDWKESEAPRPPAPKTTHLIPVEIPGTTLRYGIDPESVTLGSDGVVRYVVIASSNTGAVNALYEGIRCSTGEARIYARHNPDSGWSPASDLSWTPLQQSRPSGHSLAIARNGVCLGRSANRSVAQILQDLRSPVDRRFNNAGN
jgi:hypothetical protein